MIAWTAISGYQDVMSEIGDRKACFKNAKECLESIKESLLLWENELSLYNGYVQLGWRASGLGGRIEGKKGNVENLLFWPNPAGNVGTLLHQTLNGSLEVLNLIVELTLAVGKDSASNHSARDTAGEAKGNFAGHEDIVHVLFLAHQGKVQQDLKGLRIGGQNNQIGRLAVQRFRSCAIPSIQTL